MVSKEALKEAFEKAKKIGSRFAFEMFVEVWYDSIIEMLRGYLKDYSPADIRKMVKKGRFPRMDQLDFAGVKDYEEYLEKISVHRLMEALAEARPHLAGAIQNMGMPGAEWMVKLRSHLLECVRNPELALASSTEYKAKQRDMVLVSCDACGKQWPVPREEFENIKECPFCRTGKDEPAEPTESL